MRIVIIGGSGNLGTALIRALTGPESAGHEVRVVARRRPDPSAEGVDGSGGAGVHWHAADITRDPLEPVLTGADAVVHLAWLFQPTHSPDVTWQNNAVGTARVLAAARSSRVPVVVTASSIAAYSATRGYATVDESWPTHGASTAAYCREKAYVERLLDWLEAAAPDTRVVRIRPAFVFQRSAASAQRRLFAGPLVPGALLRPSLVPVLPIPRSLQLQAIHADDVAAAVVSVLQRDVTGAFNLAADDVLTAEALAQLCEARLMPVPVRLVRGALSAGWRAHAVPAPPELFDALMSLPTLDTGRAKTLLGWSPRVNAADAIGELVAGMREGAGGATPPLDADLGGRGRAAEFATGVGSRADPPSG